MQIKRSKIKNMKRFKKKANLNVSRKFVNKGTTAQKCTLKSAKIGKSPKKWPSSTPRCTLNSKKSACRAWRIGSRSRIRFGMNGAKCLKRAMTRKSATRSDRVPKRSRI